MCQCTNNKCSCCGGYCEVGKAHECKTKDQKSAQGSQQNKCAGGMCSKSDKKNNQ